MKEFSTLYYSLMSLVLALFVSLFLIQDKTILLNNIEIIHLLDHKIPIPFNSFLFFSQAILILIVFSIQYLIKNINISEQDSDHFFFTKLITSVHDPKESLTLRVFSHLIFWVIPFIIFLVLGYYSLKTHNLIYNLIYLFSTSLFLYIVYPLAGRISLIFFTLFIVLFPISYGVSYAGKLNWLNIKIIGDYGLVDKKKDFDSKFYKKITNRKLQSAILIKNRFISCDFSESDLSCANFSGSEFVDSNLLNFSSFKNAKSLSKVNFSNARLVNCDFSGSKLDGCNFEGANIELAKFINADLSKSKNLTINQLNNVNLNNAILPEFVLDSIKRNFKKFGFLIKKNKNYSNLKPSSN